MHAVQRNRLLGRGHTAHQPKARYVRHRSLGKGIGTPSGSIRGLLTFSRYRTCTRDRTTRKPTPGPCTRGKCASTSWGARRAARPARCQTLPNHVGLIHLARIEKRPRVQYRFQSEPQSTHHFGCSNTSKARSSAPDNWPDSVIVFLCLHFTMSLLPNLRGK